MAAFSLVHSLHTHHNSNPFHRNRPTKRTKLSLSCRSHLPPGGSKEGRDEEGDGKQGNRWLRLAELKDEAEKLGRGLKESLSPKRKGDWKDVVLMSFSFGVYVYISQKIVCAYCAWVSMVKQF